jgi:hypothetical protein
MADRRKRNQTAAFNAASMNARIGNYARAEELLVIAASSAELADQVAKLREQLAQATRAPSSPAARSRPVPRGHR